MISPPRSNPCSDAHASSEAALGVPFTPAQTAQFDTHCRFVGDYSRRRESLAAALGVPLAGPGITNDLGFVDEFHYDEHGTRALSDDFAAAIQSLL